MYNNSGGDAATVIYADTLLLVNFSMDFLALYITARLTHSVPRPLRMMAAAAIGAGFALISVLLDARLSAAALKIAGFAAWLGCAAMMTKIAFGGTWRTAAMFGSVNVGLGGIMTALYSLVGRAARTFDLTMPDTSPETSPPLFFIIAILSGAVSLLYGRFSKKSRRQTDVTIRAFGGEVKMPMLIDSGNLLRDPIGGRAVIITSAARLAAILPDGLPIGNPTEMSAIPPELMRRVRLIPAGGVTGERLLLGIVPDKVTADGRTIDAVVAIDPRDAAYDGCGGIIPDLDLL